MVSAREVLCRCGGILLYRCSDVSVVQIHDIEETIWSPRSDNVLFFILSQCVTFYFPFQFPSLHPVRISLYFLLPASFLPSVCLLLFCLVASAMSLTLDF